MNQYHHALEQWDGLVTVEMCINRARAELNEIQDYHSERGGFQAHRTAIVGKKLHAVACNKYFYNMSSHPYRLEIRVDGQYSPIKTFYMETKTDVQNLANEFNEIHPMGIEQ